MHTGSDLFCNLALDSNGSNFCLSPSRYCHNISGRYLTGDLNNLVGLARCFALRFTPTSTTRIDRPNRLNRLNQKWTSVSHRSNRDAISGIPKIFRMTRRFLLRIQPSPSSEKPLPTFPVSRQQSPIHGPRPSPQRPRTSRSRFCWLLPVPFMPLRQSEHPSTLFSAKIAELDYTSAPSRGPWHSPGFWVVGLSAKTCPQGCQEKLRMRGSRPFRMPPTFTKSAFVRLASSETTVLFEGSPMP